MSNGPGEYLPDPESTYDDWEYDINAFRWSQANQTCAGQAKKWNSEDSSAYVEHRGTQRTKSNFWFKCLYRTYTPIEENEDE